MKDVCNIKRIDTEDKVITFKIDDNAIKKYKAGDIIHAESGSLLMITKSLDNSDGVIYNLIDISNGIVLNHCDMSYSKLVNRIERMLRGRKLNKVRIHIDGEYE